MYIQITTRCNMSCGHCCYACNKKTGQDMPFKLFELIMEKWGNEITKVRKQNVILGGGEPTVHPEFWKFVTLSLSYGIPWIATNGKLTENALLLAKLGKRNLISVVLSLDKWHEPIEQEVIDAFKEGLIKYEHPWISMIPPNKEQGMREIRSIKEPYKRGCYKEGFDQCPCSHIRIGPNGLIYGCGCTDAPVIGTVIDGFFDRFKNVPWDGTCSKDWEHIKK